MWVRVSRSRSPLCSFSFFFLGWREISSVESANLFTNETAIKIENVPPGAKVKWGRWKKMNPHSPSQDDNDCQNANWKKGSFSIRPLFKRPRNEITPQVCLESRAGLKPFFMSEMTSDRPVDFLALCIALSSRNEIAEWIASNTRSPRLEIPSPEWTVIRATN